MSKYLGKKAMKALKNFPAAKRVVKKALRKEVRRAGKIAAHDY